MGKKRSLLRKTSGTSKKRHQHAEPSESDAAKRIDNREHDHDDDSDNDSDESSDAGEIALTSKDSDKMEEFTFEFYDMKEAYVESVTSLLKGMFINPTTAYEIAGAVVKQDDVGTAVVCEGGDDVFGFSTILCQASITSSPLQRVLGELLKSIEASLPREEDLIKHFQSCITGDKKTCTGVLLHRRFANFPLQLIHPLYNNLHEDLQWIRSQPTSSSTSSASVAGGHAGDSINDWKKINQLLILSTCSSAESSIAEGKAINIDRAMIYDDFEDDVFMQHSIASVAFRPAGSKIMLCAGIIPLRNMKEILASINQMCPTS